MIKLQARHRAQIVTLAYETGLVHPSMPRRLPGTHSSPPPPRSSVSASLVPNAAGGRRTLDFQPLHALERTRTTTGKTPHKALNLIRPALMVQQRPDRPS
jgi:hypothetical protein